jgi:hypothetical protein
MVSIRTQSVLDRADLKAIVGLPNSSATVANEIIGVKLWVISDHCERGVVVHDTNGHADARRLFKLIDLSPNFQNTRIVKDVTKEITNVSHATT